MEHKAFSLTFLKNLIENNKFEEANEYIKEFFFQYGSKVYFRDGIENKFVLYNDKDVKNLLSNDLVATDNIYGKKTIIYNAKFFLESTEFKALNYNPTIDFSTDDVKFTKKNRSGYPVNYINMAKPKPSFDSIEADRTLLKNELDFVYRHLKTVWANDNEDTYNWILNFLACSMTGKRKLRQCLYLPCDAERAGRGSIINFIHRVMGERIYKTSSIEELLKYNKNFEGRSLINLDELPTDTGNFRSVSDTLKSLITEPSFPCRDMYNKPYEQKNTFNFIITSNNEAVRITQSNNSRYMICNINTCKVGQHDYFKKLNDILKKPEIQKLFYEDMETRAKECEDWNEDIKPFSVVKQEKLIETLPRVLKFIKEHCVLKGEGINMKTSVFFDWYYRQSNDRTSKQKINKELKKVNIVSHKVRQGEATHNFYSITAEDLLKAYQKNGFIDDELESVEKDDDDNNGEDVIVNDLKQQLEEMRLKYEQQLEEMRLKYEQLQAKLRASPQQPPFTSFSEKDSEELEKPKPRKKIIIKRKKPKKLRASPQQPPFESFYEKDTIKPKDIRKEAHNCDEPCDDDDLTIDF